VTIDYRLRDHGMNEGGWPGAILDVYDDAVAAVEWLGEHADEYRLDPDALVAIGTSSGAVAAWNLAWLPTSPASPASPFGDTARPEPNGVRAVVSVVGAPGFVSEPAPTPSPVLAINGEADTTARPEWARDACTAARQVDARCDLMVYEGQGHFIDSTDIEDCSRQFIADTVLVDAGYVPAEAVGPSCAPEGLDELVAPVCCRDDLPPEAER
jgi:acetyl esterase/lipase